LPAELPGAKNMQLVYAASYPEEKIINAAMLHIKVLWIIFYGQVV